MHLDKDDLEVVFSAGEIIGLGPTTLANILIQLETKKTSQKLAFKNINALPICYSLELLVL